jgi:hypothetical protein
MVSFCTEVCDVSVWLRITFGFRVFVGRGLGQGEVARGVCRHVGDLSLDLAAS